MICSSISRTPSQCQRRSVNPKRPSLHPVPRPPRLQVPTSSATRSAPPSIVPSSTLSPNYHDLTTNNGLRPLPRHRARLHTRPLPPSKRQPDPLPLPQTRLSIPPISPQRPPTPQRIRASKSRFRQHRRWRERARGWAHGRQFV